MVVLLWLTIIDLRGVRSAGLVFMTPSYAFVGTLGVVIGYGVFFTNGIVVLAVLCRPAAHRLWRDYRSSYSAVCG